MADKVLNQEEIDEILKDRLKRKENSVRKEYENYISPEEYEKRTAEMTARISELEEKLSGKETEFAELEAKYSAESNEKITDLETRLNEAEAKNNLHVLDMIKMKKVSSVGLPLEAADFVKGDNEEEITGSVNSMLEIVRSYEKPTAPPLADIDYSGSDGTDPMIRMLRTMRGDV